MNRDALSIGGLDGFFGYCLVKFSMLRKDFLKKGIRGGNTSPGRTINMENPKKVFAELQGFVRRVPDGTQKIILQQRIDQAGGCLFHCEGSDHGGDRFIVENRCLHRTALPCF